MGAKLYEVREERGVLLIEGPGLVWALPSEYTRVQAESIAMNMGDCARFHEAKGREECERAKP